jgi:hypothetical protein
MSLWINQAFARYPTCDFQSDGCLCPKDAIGFWLGFVIGGFLVFVLAAAFVFNSRADIHSKIKEIFKKKEKELETAAQLPPVSTAPEVLREVQNVQKVIATIKNEIKGVLKFK